jgi:hypothetical protein
MTASSRAAHVEVHDDPFWRELRAVDVAPDVPHEQARVHVPRSDVTASPPLSPDPHLLDDREELLAGRGEQVLHGLPATGGDPLDHPDPLECLGPLRQQRR